jgi:hypothetical protein
MKSNSSKVSAFVSGSINRTAVHPTVNRDVTTSGSGSNRSIRTHTPGCIPTKGPLWFERFEK